MMKVFVKRQGLYLATGIVALLMVVLSANVSDADSRSSNKIHDIKVVEKGARTIVTVFGSKRPSFTAFKLVSPKRLVIDIADSQVRGVPSVIDEKTSIIDGVAISQYSVKGVPVSRVMINFHEDAAFRVRVKGNDLIASLNGPPSDSKRVSSSHSTVGAEIVKARTEASKVKMLYEEAQAELKRIQNENAGQQKEVLEAKRFREKAQEEINRIEAENAKRKAEAVKAKKEINRIKAENAKRKAEAVKAKEDAKKAQFLLSKERANKDSRSHGQQKLSQEVARKERRIEQYRGQVEQAEAKVLRERGKRIKIESRLEELKEQLESATRAKLKTEDSLARAGAEAAKLKKEAEKSAEAAELAKREAKKAVAAESQAVNAYQKAADGKREKLLRAAREKEIQAAEAKQKLVRAAQEKKRVEIKLLKALGDLRKATGESKTATHDRERTNRRTQKQLARVEAERSAAGRAAKLAELHASTARAEKLRVERKIEKIRQRAEHQKEEAERQAEERVAAAKAKVEKAEKAHKKTQRHLKVAGGTLTEYETRIKHDEEQIRVLAKKLKNSEEKASSAEKRAKEFAEKLKNFEEKANSAEKRAKGFEKDLADAKGTITSQKNKLDEASNRKLSQEEMRIKRLAKMRGKKAVQSQAVTGGEHEKTSGTSKSLVKDIEFVTDKEIQKIIIKVDNSIAYSSTIDDNGNGTIAFKNAKLSPMLERVLDVTDFGGIVGSVSSYNDGDNVLVDVGVEKTAQSTIKRHLKSIEWTFVPKNREDKKNQVETGPMGTVARTIAREDQGAYAYPFERTAGYALGSDSPRKKKRYTGRRIDLDFKDAGIHNILRLLADVGHVNIITGDNVKGSVTIRMRDVAWDHALDVILQAKRLGMIREGNLIRVAPLDELEKEREMEIARRKQNMALEPLETRLIPISYATADELKPRAADMLTERGNLSVDKRTNVIIARDTKMALNQIEALIRNLDTQTPQVLIEARIVEATSTYSREIGIQWGGDYSASAATGNPTGLAFPNSIGLAGGATDSQTPTAGLGTMASSTPNPNFGVNLPAAVGTGSGGALGITLGSIANNANLSIRLSAMEESGTLRILSSPRILTLDNRQASIEQGTMIPYSQVSAQGVQTAFKEAKLALNVKPHVTADGSVLLTMQVTRDEPDFNNTGARGDPTILKRQAKTELLVSDGHTAVIGGIFTRNHGQSFKKVPFFADIPILGWLFKSKSDSDRRSEMLIFITPRIVNRSESIGQ